jgi:hypothetical protein
MFTLCTHIHYYLAAMVVQHMVMTTEVLLSISFVFLLWLCAVGAFLRQWKFVQLSTPYEATRYYKPQNVDQIRIINREEDGIIYRHSMISQPRRMTNTTCSENSTARCVIDETCKMGTYRKIDTQPSTQKPDSPPKYPVEATLSDGNLENKRDRERSMPCVHDAMFQAPTNVQPQSNINKARPSQLPMLIVYADTLSKAKSSPNICTCYNSTEQRMQ